MEDHLHAKNLPNQRQASVVHDAFRTHRKVNFADSKPYPGVGTSNWSDDSETDEPGDVNKSNRKKVVDHKSTPFNEQG